MKDSQFETAHISGRNFEGKVIMNKTSIKIQVTQFRKEIFFVAQINNQILEKQYKQFLVFKKIQDLFQELIQNQQLIISDTNCLIIPIQVIYRHRKIQLKPQIYLIIKKFTNEAQKCENLFQMIKRMKQKTLNHQQANLIEFKGDKNSDNFSKIRLKSKKDLHLTYNHFEILPKKGIFCIKIRIIKSENKIIFFGICGGQIKQQSNSYQDPLFMGLYLYNGDLYGDNKTITAAPDLNVIIGKSVIRLQINMNDKKIGWFLDDKLLFQTGIRQQLMKTDIYPMINLYHQGDTIQFLKK